MSASHEPSMSPTSSAFVHFPTTPKESAVKPNPHPYAIRTTSTGILTRSNSSGHNVAASRHHYVPPSSASKDVRKRHRYAKSLSQVATIELNMPHPLPVPETFTGNAGGHKLSGWNDPTARPSQLAQDGVLLSAATLEDLPSNPKLWTASQLAAYLATALRVPSDDVHLSASAVEEVIAFTKGANINGRIFLRLVEDDLSRFGISLSWREALLAASRNLRQNVIKGRIWGGDIDNLEPPSPSLPSHPFSSNLYNSSSSSLDLTDNVRDVYKPPQRTRGRVHGMVQQFERSGSFSSESSLERDSPLEVNHRRRWSKDSVTTDEPIFMSPISDSLSLPPPSPPLSVTEEPTMEALLASSEPSGAWGARAWEEFDAAPGVTVKRLEEPIVSEPMMSADTVSRLQTMAAFNGASKAKSVRLSKGKQDRRVFTAIFTPPTCETIDDPEPTSEAVLVVESGTNSETDNVEPVAPVADTIDDTVVVHTTATERELALEAELAETRALVNAFKVRLESVERKVAELEVEVHRNEAAREKSTSFDDTARISRICISKLADIESTTAVSLDSDLSSSTLLDGEDELATGDETHALILPQDIISGSDKKSAEGVGAPDAQDGADPSSVAELPRYVLLVGLGVCAVVMRVIMKRGRGFGWRF